ncbi:MAG: outer membrane lipoprotein carrier protein LolA [Acidobacteria bacterium]|nr:outer membrane lipoprotein carrier protein LolA [Acidobacteriota bacterium]
MKKTILLIFLFFICNLFSSDITRIIDCKEAMDILDKTVQSFKSYKGKFCHTVISSDGRETTVEEGDAILKKGGKIKFAYLKPEGKIAVSNGKTAYLYLKEDNCAYKINILFKSKMPLLAKVVLGGIVPSKEFFCAFASKQDNILRLELGSKERDSSLRRLEVSIDEKSKFFSRISYVDEYEQRIIFDFYEGKSNIEILDNVFEFDPPKTAKIFESSEELQEKINF